MRGWLLAFAAAVALSTAAPWWAARTTAWMLGRAGVISVRTTTVPTPPVRRLSINVRGFAVAPNRIYALHDDALTAHSDEGALLWSVPLAFPLQATADSEAVIVRLPGRVIALHPDGGERWSLGTSLPLGAVPEPRLNYRGMAAGDKDTVYLLSDRLRAHDRRSGREIWNIDSPIYEMHVSQAGEVLVTWAGAMFVVQPGGRLERIPSWYGPTIDLTPAGERVVGTGSAIRFWKGERELRQFAVPGVSGFKMLPDGRVLGAGDDLIAFGRRGLWLWKLDTPDRIVSGPLMARDRIAYISTEAALYAVDVDGRLLWAFDRHTNRSDAAVLGITTAGAPLFLARESRGRGPIDLWLGPVPDAEAGR